MNLSDFSAIIPEIIIAVTALVILVLDFVRPKQEKDFLAYLGLLGLSIAFFAVAKMWGNNRIVFEQLFILDSFSIFLKMIFIVVAMLTFLISSSYLKVRGINFTEYYVLILLSLVGMMVLVSGANFITFYVGLELLSMSLYILSGFMREDVRSNEASVKYFLVGIFASAVMLYGISLLYGITGTTDFKMIGAYLAESGGISNPGLILAMVLLIAGFGFKIAAVPFHMWAPDVYEGAPTPVTAFMSVGPKAAGLAVLLRVLVTAIISLNINWMIILWALSVMSMTLGNIMAIAQTSIKRMLAYSSIAHVGYMLVAVVTVGYSTEPGLGSILFYLLAYAFMNIGAFGILILLGRKKGVGRNLEDFSGLNQKYPLMAIVMSVFMLSLAGIPPTSGFMGKFWIFTAAVKTGFIWLAVIGVLNSALSAFYYLRVILTMYMKEPVKELAISWDSGLLNLALLIAIFFTLLMGLFPGPFIELAQRSIMM